MESKLEETRVDITKAYLEGSYYLDIPLLQAFLLGYKFEGKGGPNLLLASSGTDAFEHIFWSIARFSVLFVILKF